MSCLCTRSLFRTMGLRHMFVSPPHPLVSGLITRKDIITGGCTRLGSMRSCQQPRQPHFPMIYCTNPLT